ncbi:hypothetical protein [Microbacterium sp. 3J1]|uniref:hypothetical protein n=1 Tax=Microbacterium sp. 3J1 TaxID=861269 RepID=UPI000B850269|nr:hypothetical protein [Microbacterium sp. 3J1]
MNNSAINMTINNSDAFTAVNDRFLQLDSRPHAPIPTATLQEAMALVDASGVADLFVEWATEDGKTVRATRLSARQVLAVWIALELAQRESTISNVTSALSEHLTPARRRALGLTDDFLKHSREQVARMVRRATVALTDLMDAFPTSTRGRRLTKGEWDGVLAERASISVELEQRRKRFLAFANRLLEAQHKIAAVSDSQQGVSVVVDSRFRSAGVRGVGQRRMDALGDTGRVSLEPDAGFWVQDPTGADRQARYGWEDELAVLISSDPGQPRSVPNIVIGFNPHLPSSGFATAAAEMLHDIAGRGAGLDHVVLDRAYMATRPDVLRTPLMNLGVKLVADYPTNRLGVQALSDTGILVDGTWYAPSLPVELQDAGREFASVRGGAALSDRMEAAKVLKKKVTARAEFSRQHPRATDVSDRDEQHYPYKSEQWNKVNGMGRGAFETYAAALSRTEQNRPGRRRMRGATALAFLGLLEVVGTNARILEDFRAAQQRPRTRTVVLPPLAPAAAPPVSRESSDCRPKQLRQPVLMCPAVGKTSSSPCKKREAGN